METKYFRWWSWGDGICYSFRFPFPLHLFRGWKSGVNISEYKVIFVWKFGNKPPRSSSTTKTWTPNSFAERMWCMRFPHSFLPNFLINKYVLNLALRCFRIVPMLSIPQLTVSWRTKPSHCSRERCFGSQSPLCFVRCPRSPRRCITGFFRH